MSRGHFGPPRSIGTERCRRTAGGISVEPVHEPGGGLGASLLVAPVLGRGGDVEAVQPGAGERAGRGLHWPGRAAPRAAHRRGCIDARARLRRSPPRCRRRRPPSGRRGFRAPSVDRDEHPAVRDRAPCRRRTSNAWMTRGPLSARYIVRAVGAPAQPVGDRQAVEHQARSVRPARAGRGLRRPSR